MPSYRHHDHGNLYIQFDVKFPTSIQGPADKDGQPTSMSAQQIKALESVLPPQLERVDPLENSRSKGAHGMDDDEDEMGGGGERVQCASQ
jgi:DnaJ family protein A protein 2